MKGLRMQQDLGFPKIRATGLPLCAFMGIPIIRAILYLGQNWGPLLLGNYHFLASTISCIDRIRANRGRKGLFVIGLHESLTWSLCVPSWQLT